MLRNPSPSEIPKQVNRECDFLSVQIQLFCKGFRGMLENIRSNSPMKTKVHSRQSRNKVVEKLKASLGYKSIFQALNFSLASVYSIIWTWIEHATSSDLPREGHSPNCLGRERISQRSQQGSPKLTVIIQTM